MKLEPEPVSVPSQNVRELIGLSVSSAMVYSLRSEVSFIRSLPCQAQDQPDLSTIRLVQDPGEDILCVTLCLEIYVLS